MKAVVIGPVFKDVIVINGEEFVQTGAIPFYTGNALRSLGNDVTVIITHSTDYTAEVKKSFNGIKTISIISEGTLQHRLTYSKENPNIRDIELIYSPNTIGPEDIRDKLDSFDVIIMGPIYYENTPLETFRALPKNKIVALGNFGMFSDPVDGKRVERNPERLIDALKYVDWLFLDEREIKFAARENTLEKAVKKLQKHVKNIVVTKGSEGSVVFYGGKRFEIPSYKPKKLVDPTGAGDTYQAAFLHMFLKTKDIEKSGKFAAMAATMKIERAGPLDKSEKEIIGRLLLG